MSLLAADVARERIQSRYQFRWHHFSLQLNGVNGLQQGVRNVFAAIFVNDTRVIHVGAGIGVLCNSYSEPSWISTICVARHLGLAKVFCIRIDCLLGSTVHENVSQ